MVSNGEVTAVGLLGVDADAEECVGLATCFLVRTQFMVKLVQQVLCKSLVS